MAGKVVTWRGKMIDEMTREELIAALEAEIERRKDLQEDAMARYGVLRGALSVQNNAIDAVRATERARAAEATERARAAEAGRGFWRRILG